MILVMFLLLSHNDTGKEDVMYKGKGIEYWRALMLDRGASAYLVRKDFPLIEKPDPLAVPLLRSLLVDNAADVRQAALYCLAYLGEGAFPALPEIERCLSDEDPDVQSAAARAIGSIGPKAGKAGPVLLKLLKSPDSPIRNSAALASLLAKVNQDEAILALRPEIEDKSGSPSTIFMELSECKGNEKVVQLFREIVSTPKQFDSWKRARAAEGLGLICANGDVLKGILKPALTDDDLGVRVAAAHSLALTKNADPVSIDVLIGVVKYPKTSPYALDTTIRCLELCGAKAAKANEYLLEIAQHHSDETIRDLARKALKAIAMPDK